MSVKAMSQVWDMPCPAKVNGKDFLPVHKFTLVAYADHADHQGKNIYPAVPTIAKKTGFHERTVQRATRDLEEMQLLIADGKGPRGTNKWMLGGGSLPGVTFRQGDRNAKSLGDTDSGDILSGDTTPPELKELNQNEIDLYIHFKEEIQKQIKRALYITWIEPTYPIGREDQTLIIAAPNGLARNWLEANITADAQQVTGMYIRFVVHQEAEET